MDHQEWFESIIKKLSFAEDRYVYEPGQFNDDWKAIRIVFIKMAADLLPKLEKRIVTMIYDDGLSERKVAEKIGISRAKVHRRKKKALSLLFRSVIARYAIKQP